jgi:hypothetical protein
VRPYGIATFRVRLELPDNLRFYARWGCRIVGEESHIWLPAGPHRALEGFL